MIQNLEETLSKIRPHLREYLEEQGLDFNPHHFQCPNFQVHKREDKKPAANFWPDEEHWKCWACDARGDIFDASFYLEGRALSGPEFITDNVAYLAEKYQIPFDLEISSVEGNRRQLYSLVKLASEILLRGKDKVQDVLKLRHWDSIQDRFGFGAVFHKALIDELSQNGFLERAIRETGLLDYGLFEGRLVFPLHNHFGKVVGFASREINGGGEKYLSSMTTEIYKKSRFLFNFWKARKYSKLYVFEGYSDVFTAVANKLENVVALGWATITEGQYELLVKNGTVGIVICLDNDPGGKTALENILNGLLVKPVELKVRVKPLDVWEDPDEYILKEGIEKFKALPEYDIFDFRLKQLKEKQVDKKVLFDLVSAEPSQVEKEQRCRRLSEVLNVSYESVLADLQIVQKTATKDFIGSFEKEVMRFEEWAFSRTGTLLGLDTGFPMLTQKLDGLQNGFYVVGADTNVGKTAFLLTLAYNLIVKNSESVYILFFSLDDPILKIIPRLAALTSGIEINSISNPVYKIQRNEQLTSEQALQRLQDREKAIDGLKKMDNCFTIKDESSAAGIRQLDMLEKVIKDCKQVADKKQLVVFIDSIHKIQIRGSTDARDKYMNISDNLKAWTTSLGIPIICTAELRKKQSVGARPSLEDVKETIDIIYDSDVGMLIYNEFEFKKDTQLQFVDRGQVYPVVELMVKKNKISPFKSSLFYRFYTDLSRYTECALEENRRFLGLR